MRKPDTDPDEHRPVGRGGKAEERLNMFHEARGISKDPVAHNQADYSAAVLAAITGAEAAGPGAANLPPWRFLGPDVIPGGQTGITATRVTVSGRVSAIAVDPQNPYHLLCGSAAGGIWESFSCGASWAPRTEFMPTLTIGAIAFDPNNARNNTRIVYAGTGEGNSYWYLGQGMLRSTDGGTTWTLLTAAPFVNVGFYQIIVDPANSQHILAAVNGRVDTGGLYESTDGGVSWARVIPAYDCYDISMQPGGTVQQPDGTRTGEVLATTPGGLRKSTDGGRTWNPEALPAGAPASWTRLAVSISTVDPRWRSSSGPPRTTPRWRTYTGAAAARGRR